MTTGSRGLTCFSGYLVVFFGAVVFEKPLYTVDSFRPSPGLYDQAAFVEMQTPLVVQKALERAFSKD